jgi:peptidyl-dipeptidase Dcp
VTSEGASFDVALGPALEAAMAEHRAEVDAIAGGPWPPTFEDTIAALERSGARLHLAENLLSYMGSARSTPDVRALEAEMLPRLAAHHDAVALHPRVFARIADLAARRDELSLDDEQSAVLERYHRDLVREGATLDGDARARLLEINERLSALTGIFRANLIAETDALGVHVATAAELDGLPAPLVDASARDSGYVLRLALPSAQPAHEHLHDRDLRRRLYEAAVARGRRGGPHDNRAVVCEMTALRAERAGLLGFGSHAEYALAEQTAESVDAVMQMLGAVGTAAATAARAEAERHTAALHADGHDGPLEPWDWPYYAARERRARYAVDDARLQEFFALDRVVHDGLFALARDLYGLTFTPRDDLPRPHPDARAWTVTGSDGRDRGVMYLDPFARDGKAGGAWLDAFAEPAPLIGRPARPIIVMNATPPAHGAPTLLTPLDVRILFHEFGHALHMLLSDVAFPRIAGLNVAYDVVEFSSRLHESLAVDTRVLERYARHHETGATLPEAYVGALQAYVRDSAPFNLTRAAAGALLDQAWHGLAPGEGVDPEAVDAFEDAVRERHGLAIRAVGLSYRSTFFAHIFGGDYDGTQYSYEWSAMLEATALAWLDEQGGPTREAGERLRDDLLARGAVVDPLAALCAITGREASVEPMLQRRGLL